MKIISFISLLILILSPSVNASERIGSLMEECGYLESTAYDPLNKKANGLLYLTDVIANGYYFDMVGNESCFPSEVVKLKNGGIKAILTFDKGDYWEHVTYRFLDGEWEKDSSVKDDEAVEDIGYVAHQGWLKLLILDTEEQSKNGYISPYASSYMIEGLEGAVRYREKIKDEGREPYRYPEYYNKEYAELSKKLELLMHIAQTKKNGYDTYALSALAKHFGTLERRYEDSKKYSSIIGIHLRLLEIWTMTVAFANDGR